MLLRQCIHCEIEFDAHSPEKQRAGGKINECPECAVEPEVPYLGVQIADGKQAGLQVLSFRDQKSREKFSRIWQKNAGMHKGKSSALGVASSTQSVSFKKIAEFEANKNHKGKS